MDKLNKNIHDSDGSSKEPSNQNDNKFSNEKFQDSQKKKKIIDPIEEEQLKQAKIEWIKKGNSFLADACDEALGTEASSKQRYQEPKFASPEQKKIQDRIDRIEADEAYIKSLDKESKEEDRAIKQELKPKQEDRAIKQELKSKQEDLLADKRKKYIPENSNNESIQSTIKIFRRITATKFIFKLLMLLIAIYSIKYFLFLLTAF